MHVCLGVVKLHAIEPTRQFLSYRAAKIRDQICALMLSRREICGMGISRCTLTGIPASLSFLMSEPSDTSYVGGGGGGAEEAEGT